MIGRALGHYQITGLLGKGGMGEVYRARDTTLDRDVALKVLPVDVARDPTRLERFRREAKTVAGLNHPHIVTLFSVEEHSGVHFITMELVEGKGLDAIMTGDGLSLPRVIDVGSAVADALAAAHEKNIVHRDLKPANVKLTRDGRVKVLDFGLAKLSDRRSPDGDTATQIAPITSEGSVMGTVPYMSPEQLRGQDVDQRSDIFSLGVLLYEMASGRRPFGGATNTDVISSILRDTPAPLPHVRPDVPQQLGRIVSQCLQKEPDDRYHAAKDIRNELKALRREMESSPGVAADPAIAPASVSHAPARRSRRSLVIVIAAAFAVSAVALFLSMNRDHASDQRATTTEFASEHKTIAVLPFVNMSADPEQEFFSDGISEELLNLLSKVSSLRVAARTSSFSFKGHNVPIQEIGKQLNVEYLLEGSVRRANDEVRVTAQLIHVNDGYHVWSEAYDRKLDDIFAIQNEIAADVVKQLEIKLLGKAPAVRKTDPEAYGLFLQSVQLQRLFTREAFDKADSLLTRVLQIDSLYAPAWSMRASILTNRGMSGMTPMKEAFEKSRQAAQRALEVDPTCEDAYAALAWLEMYGSNDLAAAAQHLEKGFAIDPSRPELIAAYGSLLQILGRKDQVLALREAEAERDPVNENALYNLASARLLSGRLDDAIATYRTVLALSPGNGATHYQIGVAMLLEGDAAGALAEFEQETIDFFKMSGTPMAYYAMGRKADADAALNELIGKYGNEAAINVAVNYAFRGDADNAFRWLEKERATTNAFAEITIDPFLTRLADDPRWLPFLRRIGKAPEQLEKIKLNVNTGTL